MIDQTIYIDRKRTDSEEKDFNKLKEEGIKLLQQLSGEIWSDYNTHDPGVTILEQLVFALTELMYLADFNVEDILTPESGEINYNKQALYEPHEIFPSETITEKDYCKSICDHVTGIRNIWIIKSKEKEKKGLYRFLIDLENKYIGKEESIIQKLVNYFNSIRNLCEDIEAVEILRREPVELVGIIEIDTAHSPEDVLSSIMFECFKIISPRTVFNSYKDLVEQGLSLEEILRGPFIENGYIKDEDLLPHQQNIYISQLMKAVFNVDGVVGIKDFYLLKENKKIRTRISFNDIKKGAYIKLPLVQEELLIRLERNDRVSTVNLEEVLRNFFHKLHQYKSNYNTVQDLHNLFQLPKGKYMDIGNFYSIQNQFPEVYGINNFGVPPSAGDTRIAQSKQLKGYILLFEQLMADFLAQLKNLPKLFSAEPGFTSSYFSEPHVDVPNLKGLLKDTWEQNIEVHTNDLKQIMSNYDDYYDRRNRLLDFILSMYGEKFSQKTFIQFKYYYTDRELPRILCENKEYILKNLVHMNRYKARSFNYLTKSWNTQNIPYVKIKISLLLGIKDFSRTAYSDVLANHNMKLIHSADSETYFQKILNRKEWILELDEPYIKDNFIGLPDIPLSCEQQFEEIAFTAKKVDYLDRKIIYDEFFRYGINLQYYKIGLLNRRKVHVVLFKHPKIDEYIFIGEYKSPKDAVLEINCLQKFLIRLNQESEGMHIVEHILLRSREKGPLKGCKILNHHNNTAFTTSTSYLKPTRDDYIEELKRILPNRYNYTIEDNEAGYFQIFIHKEGEKVLWGYENHLSAEDAADAIEDYCAFYSEQYQSNNLENSIQHFYQNDIDDDFYENRISVVLPGWSARFNNWRFRDYVEETFSVNLPAHIMPDFHWLDLPELSLFEELFSNWLEAKTGKDQERTDILAKELIHFLQECKKGNNKE